MAAETWTNTTAESDDTWTNTSAQTGLDAETWSDT